MRTVLPLRQVNGPRHTGVCAGLRAIAAGCIVFAVFASLLPRAVFAQTGAPEPASLSNEEKTVRVPGISRAPQLADFENMEASAGVADMVKVSNFTQQRPSDGECRALNHPKLVLVIFQLSRSC